MPQDFGYAYCNPIVDEQFNQPRGPLYQLLLGKPASVIVSKWIIHLLRKSRDSLYGIWRYKVLNITKKLFQSKKDRWEK